MTPTVEITAVALSGKPPPALAPLAGGVDDGVGPPPGSCVGARAVPLAEGVGSGGTVGLCAGVGVGATGRGTGADEGAVAVETGAGLRAELPSPDDGEAAMVSPHSHLVQFRLLSTLGVVCIDCFLPLSLRRYHKANATDGPPVNASGRPHGH